MSGGPTHLVSRPGNFGLLSRDIMSALWPDKRLSTTELVAIIGPAMLRSRGVTNYLKARGLLRSMSSSQGHMLELADRGMVASALLSPMKTTVAAQAYQTRVVPNPPVEELLTALTGHLREELAALQVSAYRAPPAPPPPPAAAPLEQAVYAGEIVPPRRYDTFTARLPTDPGPPLPRAGSMDALRLPSVIGGRLLTQHSPEQLARGGRGLA